MLTYNQYKPSQLLDPFIECFWTCNAPAMTMSALEPLVPGGRTEVIFNFGSPMQFLISNDLPNGEAITHAHVMGQRSKVYYTKQHGETSLLGVRFKPGAFSAFTSIPAAALLNQVVPVEAIFSSASCDWKSRLLEKKNETERIHLLDELFVQLSKNITSEWRNCTKAVDTIRKGNSVSVHALCSENESYYKKLERDFLKHVGYTPKYYSRIVRFNKAIRLMQSTKENLTSICYDCDYYDQSHFIKDFHQFTGTTPKRFQTEHHSIADFLLTHQVV